MYQLHIFAVLLLVLATEALAAPQSPALRCVWEGRVACKKRGVCPSCGARRMVDVAAHWVDHVIPDVPVRQWVLSLPHRIRYLVGYDAKLLGEVRALFMRAV